MANAKTSASAPASASVAASSVSSATCRNGTRLITVSHSAHGDCFDGPCSGDGIGLGAVGAPATKSESTIVEGHALPTDDLSIYDVDREVCAALGRMSLCIEKSRVGKPALEGAVEAALTFKDGLAKHATIVGGTLTDAPLLKCVTDNLTGVKLDAGSGTARYALSIDARHYKALKTIDAGAAIKGKLPPEVVKRIIRANFPRFRACYAAALKKTSTLTGDVAVKFRIDKTGATAPAWTPRRPRSAIRRSGRACSRSSAPSRSPRRKTASSTSRMRFGSRANSDYASSSGHTTPRSRMSFTVSSSVTIGSRARQPSTFSAREASRYQ